MADPSARDIVDRLLAGSTTYAEAAGIRLTDRPAPLYRLLVLAELLSTRIAAGIAVEAARELLAAGLGTPRHMLEAQWQDIVNALGRAGYRRYDESTATRLQRNAAAVLDSYRGDLRRLAEESGHNRADAAELLQRFDGIGPVGASIYLREVQDTWPWVAPYFDDRAVRGAEQLGLPADPDQLAGLCPPEQTSRLAAALVRRTTGRSATHAKQSG